MHTDHPCDARISYPYRGGVGGPFRLSLLKTGASGPPPSGKVSRKGLWRAPQQPLWAVSQPREAGNDWMLVFTLEDWREPPVDDAVPLGLAYVSGKWWKGRHSFVEAIVKSPHIKVLRALAGDWILDRLNPRRTSGVVRQFPDHLEAWARL